MLPSLHKSRENTNWELAEFVKSTAWNGHFRFVNTVSNASEVFFCIPIVMEMLDLRSSVPGCLPVIGKSFRLAGQPAQFDAM